MALNDVPQAGQTLATSQPLIRTNFSVIDTAFAVDHVACNIAGQGKHNQVVMPRQAASPITGVTESAIFSRLSTLSAQTELAVRKESNGAVYEFTSCGASAVGWTRLPSGILLKWGNAAANGFATYTYPVAANIPVFSQIFTVQITTWYIQAGDVPDGFVRLSDFTTTQIAVYSSPRTTTGPLNVSFQYLAIGL
jgi:hypothetical protein